VVARIEGRDPQLKDDYLVYSAHWDHFGWNPALPGVKHDQVFHGAVDNASGTAALLAIARAFRALPEPPRRSILFIATTAEERGLLGAQYYATHPLYPLRRTVADINIDTINVLGRTHDIRVVGFGNSDLDDRLAEAAASQGRVVGADSGAERGSFFRADHFEFAKVGVPALYTGGGDDYIDKPAGFGAAATEDYIGHAYHKPADQIRPDWDLSGAVEDIRLLYRVGADLAAGNRFPQWRPDSEFRARRQQTMQSP
jgi:Zn-dependent M28 family amino/carboxypeptidase